MRNPLGKSSVAQILDEHRLMGSLHFPEAFFSEAVVRAQWFRCHEAVCVGWAKRPDANASGGVPTMQREDVRYKNGGHGAKSAPLPTLRLCRGLSIDH